MLPDERRRMMVLLSMVLPGAGWWLIARLLPEWQTWPGVLLLIKTTASRPNLLLGIGAGACAAWLLMRGIDALMRSDYGGEPFKRAVRGTKVVSQGALARRTREPGAKQIDIAGIPMPREIENLHMLVVGPTGSGKSVLLRQLVISGCKRGDRFILIDPNGDLLSRFGRPEKDVILNPFDARSQGWSFFNEIRNPDFDFERFALSIVPRGQTKEAEEWAGYARLLLRETARKLYRQGTPDVGALTKWVTEAPADQLRKFLSDTPAIALFVGADRALASARFLLGDKLPPHNVMPAGGFSLRGWLDDAQAGNLFITWREDMAEALKPLISAWADVLCTSVLSTPENERRRLWLIIDELASLEKLASLEAALTKGRKHGLRVVAGLQSTAQLETIYGVTEAQTLRACFRSLVILSGAHTDPKTASDMSQSIGEHEVAREQISATTQGARIVSRNSHEVIAREPIVLPSEISSMPNLSGLVVFTGGYPAARITLTPRTFPVRMAAFQEARPGGGLA